LGNEGGNIPGSGSDSNNRDIMDSAIEIKRAWTKGVASRVDNELEELEDIFRQLKQTRDPALAKLMVYHIQRLDHDMTVEKTSKYLKEGCYKFEVDEDGDHVFEFTGHRALKSAHIAGYH
jgi:hypothetical protein